MDAFALHAVLADGTFQLVQIGSTSSSCAGSAYTDTISTSSSSNPSSDDEDGEFIMPVCASRIGKLVSLLCQSVSTSVHVQHGQLAIMCSVIYLLKQRVLHTCKSLSVSAQSKHCVIIQ